MKPFGWKLAKILLFLCGLIIVANCDRTYEIPTGIEFDSFVFRSGDNGDNWCLTWADDGDLYTSQCDGRGWRYENGNQRDFMNNQVWKIKGGPDPDSFMPFLVEGAPDYSRTAQQEIYGQIQPGDSAIEFPQADRLDVWNWYSYGIVSIEGNIYQFISHCGERSGFGWFDGSQLIWRPSSKKEWIRWNGTDANDREKWLINEGGNQLFFYQEQELAFSFITVAQFGQDYELNRDGYVYLYSPTGKEKSNLLNMARVKKEDILDRSKWEFFTGITENGQAGWSPEIDDRGVVHRFPEGWGFYSWSPSVVWNEGLQLFIMAVAGTQKPGTGGVLEKYMHYESGGLMFLWAENPWGTWKQFYWEENWVADDPENRLYLPQLSPKWISKDGRSMYMVFSDAGRSYSLRYLWNMQKIHFTFD